MDKPYRVRRCTVCQRRRHMQDLGVDRADKVRMWLCSQGHLVTDLLPTMERMDRITREVILPSMLNYLQTPSPLLAYLRR